MRSDGDTASSLSNWLAFSLAARTGCQLVAVNSFGSRACTASINAASCSLAWLCSELSSGHSTIGAGASGKASGPHWLVSIGSVKAKLRSAFVNCVFALSVIVASFSLPVSRFCSPSFAKMRYRSRLLFECVRTLLKLTILAVAAVGSTWIKSTFGLVNGNRANKLLTFVRSLPIKLSVMVSPGA